VSKCARCLMPLDDSPYMCIACLAPLCGNCGSDNACTKHEDEVDELRRRSMATAGARSPSL
jgi:hypothetical protein